jgi:hypothetical protein
MVEQKKNTLLFDTLLLSTAYCRDEIKINGC